MTTDKGAKAPTTLEEMAENVAVALLDRDLAPHFEAARSVGWDLLEKAGVPALLARVAEVEGSLAFYASPENYKPDWHGEEFAPVVRLDRGAKARAALAEKSSH